MTAKAIGRRHQCGRSHLILLVAGEFETV